MTDAVAAAVKKVLNQIRDTGPEEILYRVQGELRKTDLTVREADILEVSTSPDLNDPARRAMHMALAVWDSAASAEWTQETRPGSPARRRVIYDLLELSGTSREVLDRELPSASQMDAMIVDPENWTPWYDESRKAAHDFYWRAYRAVLEGKGWDVEALATLDRSTTEIVQRLADPSSAEGYQTKGLVVGHVQSGKTANFTGIVAKAIDSGYRLIIVLTGTIELLRAQTQRRLDMELIGEENILDGVDPTDVESTRDIDYISTDDADWLAGNFLRHGQDIHSLPEVPAIKRLTTVGRDYRKLRLGRDVLDFRRTGELRDTGKPVYAPENVHSVDARIAVLKKNTTSLANLIHDLKNIRADGREIPVLIIDDEADQASVNTVNPRATVEAASDLKERSAINKLIAELLKDLPRAQYVGYTATPFANVFISPDDSEDLFPKDFLVSLQPSNQYMGGAAFHDLGNVDESDRGNPSVSNEAAFVRDLVASREEDPEGEEAEILEAIDTFVLTGALKKWRASLGAGFGYRHHTMLVHESIKTADHLELAERFREIWRQAAYGSSEALARLEARYNQDLTPTHFARDEWSSLPWPSSFTELLSAIGEARDEILSDRDPVVVVNGTKESDYSSLDFQTRPYWRILVGGAKLSRGFTVEGLTVTYYRRRAAAADTLMQMGRWFGYRTGYGDLVRLYIARRVLDGRGRVFDLYDAFTSIIQDEEEFREQLRKFSEIEEDGRPVLRPIHVPPLVFQQLPWLKPTGANKMYNAVLAFEGEGGVVKDFNSLGHRLDGASNLRNFAIIRPLIETLSDVHRFFGIDGTSFDARYSILDNSTVAAVLRGFELSSPDQLNPTAELIRKAAIEGVLSDWVVIVPELDASYRRALDGVTISVAERQRRKDRPGFAGSERRHRATLEVITQKPDREAEAGPVAAKLSSRGRGALLISFAIDPELTAEEMELHGRALPARVKREAWPSPLKGADVATLLSVAVPYSAAPRGRIGFSVRREESAGLAIVDRAVVEKE
ncbi:Z1 domain-containing protein [Curtobacterium poinsettiae]|uniref:Z1 domain-containing protein n=1 Tax=Curtobacterium poinsettiae TaxID=159612 RepID=UPI0021C941DA|nr:Z1 domain-containing protein [Curtobacterium flaccumfaciens]MCU0114874.1 Z1 domain-containing protein [Curtobacterium flaccumfaciens]